MHATTEESEDETGGLSTQARRALRARAHGLKPVVWIAQAGATPAVLREIDRALTAHELVKLHAAVDGRDAREALLASICTELGAQPVQVIGKMLVAFRPRPVAIEDGPERARHKTDGRTSRAAPSSRRPQRPPRKALPRKPAR